MLSVFSIPNSCSKPDTIYLYVCLKATDLGLRQENLLCQSMLKKEVFLELSQEVSSERWNRNGDELRKEQSGFIALFKKLSGKN